MDGQFTLQMNLREMVDRIKLHEERLEQQYADIAKQQAVMDQQRDDMARLMKTMESLVQSLFSSAA